MPSQSTVAGGCVMEEFCRTKCCVPASEIARSCIDSINLLQAWAPGPVRSLRFPGWLANFHFSFTGRSRACCFNPFYLSYEWLGETISGCFQPFPATFLLR